MTRGTAPRTSDHTPNAQIPGPSEGGLMAKKDKNTGFQASAGLIRYFDAEEKSAFRIHPNVVIALSLLTAIAIYVVKIVWPV